MAQREKDEAELLCVIAGDGPPAPLCSGQEKRRSDPIRPAEGMVLPVPAAAPAAATTAREVKRCAGCRKRVGLMGFRCRCGKVFCGEHRYSERHVCSYDYKAAGREIIARENPLVRAAKIVRV